MTTMLQITDIEMDLERRLVWVIFGIEHVGPVGTQHLDPYWAQCKSSVNVIVYV